MSERNASIDLVINANLTSMTIPNFVRAELQTILGANTVTIVQ